MALPRVPYITWRPQADGSLRPRFQPGPRQRALGFVNQDLKSEAGAWFTYEQARGFMLGADGKSGKLAEIKAATASGKRIRPPPAPKGRTVEDLINDYLNSSDFKRLRENTQSDYRFKSYAVLYKPEDRRAQHKDKTAREREPFSLAPAAAIAPHNVKAFFEYLVGARGLVMARQAIMLLSSAYKWGRLDASWRLQTNPCNAIGMPKPKPRVMVWDVAEVRAIVAAADAIGEPELGDAVLLALFSGQRQGDVLAFTGAGVSDGVIRLTQAKTGTRVEVPIITPLAARLEQMQRRRIDKKYNVAELVVDSRTARAFNAFTFRHRFAALREITIAGDRARGLDPCPSIAGKEFRDLRDTALTWLSWAGNDIKNISGVSGHALASLAQVLPHYIAIGSPDARIAMARLSTWLEEKGMAV